MTNESISDRMSDMVAAVTAVDAFRRSDRQAVISAMNRVTAGRECEALLAVALLSIDQAARAVGVSWEAIANVILTAAMDPDELDALRRRIREQS